MSLKFMLDNLEGLDDSVAALYTKHDDGKHYLEVDGAVSKSKLDEFRNNNVDLLRKLDGYKDLDPAKYASMQTQIAELTREETIPADKLDEIVAERVGNLRNEYDGKINDFETVISTQSRQLEGLVIDSAVRKAATEGKVLPTAVDDVLLRAKSTFKVIDGAAVPHDSKGSVVYGKDGSSPMGIGEWMGKLSKDASHLFEGSSGGGGTGGGRQTGGQQDTSKMSAVQKIAAGLQNKQ
jgi:hypothetical protein